MHLTNPFAIRQDATQGQFWNGVHLVWIYILSSLRLVAKEISLSDYLHINGSEESDPCLCQGHYWEVKVKQRNLWFELGSVSSFSIRITIIPWSPGFFSLERSQVADKSCTIKYNSFFFSFVLFFVPYLILFIQTLKPCHI